MFKGRVSHSALTVATLPVNQTFVSHLLNKLDIFFFGGAVWILVLVNTSAQAPTDQWLVLGLHRATMI